MYQIIFLPNFILERVSFSLAYFEIIQTRILLDFILFRFFINVPDPNREFLAFCLVDALLVPFRINLLWKLNQTLILLLSASVSFSPQLFAFRFLLSELLLQFLCFPSKFSNDVLVSLVIHLLIQTSKLTLQIGDLQLDEAITSKQSTHTNSNYWKSSFWWRKTHPHMHTKKTVLAAFLWSFWDLAHVLYRAVLVSIQVYHILSSTRRVLLACCPAPTAWTQQYYDAGFLTR